MVVSGRDHDRVTGRLFVGQKGTDTVVVLVGVE